MVTVETAAALLLAGYIIGDTLGPVRRAVVDALDAMGDGIDDAVDERGGS